MRRRSKTIHFGTPTPTHNDESLNSQIQKKMTTADEDILISKILKQFDVIEKKTTNKASTARKVEEEINEAWQQIQNEFHDKTNVTMNIKTMK